MTLQGLERRLRRVLRGDDVARTDGICRASPEWLVLCINNFCNLHCKMCDVGLGEEGTVFYANLIGSRPQNMSLGLIDKIASEAKTFHPPPRVGLAYTEPLIHARILEICEALKRRGLYVSITTNGYLLPRLADDLVEIGVDFLTVSVDGSRGVHNSVRRSGDSFERLYEGVELVNRAKEHGRSKAPVIQFSYTITDENYTDMVAFVKEVEGLRPDSLSFSHLNFVTSEMAAVHNRSYDGELSVTRSNLGEMDLDQARLPSSSFLVCILRRAASERFAGATGSRVAFACWSSSENSSGRQASIMCHWT